MTERRRLRRARFGVSGVFLVFGFTLAAWATNLPTVQARTHASSSAIGLVIVAVGLGTITGSQIAGQLLHRVSARGLASAGAAVMLVAVNLFPLARDPLGLGLIGVLQGIGSGCVDVSMNNQAATLQRRYGRPIMSTFHALFSVGGAVGAGYAAILQAANVSYPLILLAFSVAAVAVGVVALWAMLPGVDAGAGSAAEGIAGGGEPGPAPKLGRRIALLGTLAFLLMLSEGIAGNWAALHAVHVLHQRVAAASLAYGTFAVCMTIGRFLVDRVVAAFGPEIVVRYGALIAAVGMLVVVISRYYPLTLLGWAVYGIGLSGGVPQVFTAGANLPSRKPGAAMAQVVGVGYVGELGGPAVIGAVAGLIGLAGAFCIPLGFCLIAGSLAGAVRPAPRRDAAPGAV